jgi:hypothetical protein
MCSHSSWKGLLTKSATSLIKGYHFLSTAALDKALGQGWLVHYQKEYLFY